jgi:thiol-disulfide isomerase/thioredoxin
LTNDYVIDFIPKEADVKDTLSVRNKIVLYNKLLSFYPIQMYTGDLVVNDTIVRFQVWPFQAGPSIRILNEASIIGYDRYEMEETFVLDSFVVSFTDFSFMDKSVQVNIEKLDSETILYGYKVGRRIKGWADSNTIWDSLGLRPDMPLMIYFGGSWCPPCLQELPRLKNIANVCSNYGISVLSAAALYKDSRNDALEYLNRNEYPGSYYISSLDNPISLNKNLNISSYPTYVFISGEGEVLFRAESKMQRDRELNFFFSQYVTQLKSN